jgi:uncharacterized protein YceK
MRRIAALALFALILTVSGCATAVNLSGYSGIYGGTRINAEILADNIDEDTKLLTGGTVQGHSEVVSPVFVCACLIDLPFSVVADTLTLPWTVFAELRRIAVPKEGTDTQAEFDEFWLGVQAAAPSASNRDAPAAKSTAVPR